MKTPDLSHRATQFLCGGFLIAVALGASHVLEAQEAGSLTPAATPAPPTPVEKPAPPPLAPSPTVESPTPPAPPAPRATPAPRTPAEGGASATGGQRELNLELSAPGGGAPTRLRIAAPRPVVPGGIAGAGLGGGALTVADVFLNEEVSGAPEESARSYEAVIAEFDRSRSNAAQAIFRLGEAYRKAGRTDEARVQYARILREFVDFAELVTLSQQQLTQGLPRQQAGQPGMTFHYAGSGDVLMETEESGASGRQAAARVVEEERALLREEIDLLETQVEETRIRIANGSVPATSLVPLQREILQLRRQLLRISLAEAPPQPTPARILSGFASGAVPASPGRGPQATAVTLPAPAETPRPGAEVPPSGAVDPAADGGGLQRR